MLTLAGAVAVVLMLLPVLLAAALSLDGLRHTAARLRAAVADRPLALVVSRRRIVGADAVQLSLVSEWRPLPAARAGQHLVFDLPVEGRVVRRAYSLSRHDRLALSWEVTVKRETGGAGSGFLIDRAVEGCRLTVSRPRGSFLDTDPDRPVVLVAAGVGITPFRAMLMARRRRPRAGRTVLWFTARTRTSLYFHDEFAALEQATGWFRYRPVLTGDAPADWAGGRERLTAAAILRDLPAGADVLLCTGKAMETALVEGLVAAGFPRARIRHEQFAAASEEAEVAGELTVVTASGSRRLAPGRATSLLDVLDRAGCAPPYECRVGDCGHCRVEITAGTVHDLDGAGPVCGRVLACRVRPDGDATVAL
ncbi:2Fe-2S iron-sulfur cluster-binding protein [Methylobrevis pamukkalensis]|uniref:3-ketosteroid-9-alpha-hydroxylase reductase subunit n=1 Tax=Methylobrevis pamukkalensis TaxID=1439726 RepID=A0A1E3H8G0_9HYPH|nr:2Fe-2S iron-sulfur cluster-binding protein [Methylobrevis pamukkalensis]ODN72086.1 3-ketosteroid-9-alpha-hydroxylase reductase subunit [Methylobrevis pamukkalensis]